MATIKRKPTLTLNTNFEKNTKTYLLDIIYLFLSLLSSILELGPVILLISKSMMPVEILGVALTYQIGNLVASTIRIDKRKVVALLFIAVVCVYLSSINWFLFYPTIMLLSLGLQKTRRFVAAINIETGVTTFSKRLVRILGFALSGVISYRIFTLLAVGILIITLIVALWRKESWVEKPTIRKPHWNPLATVMVSHQSHYFSYTYFMPILFIHYLHIPVSFVGLAFTVGWISYALAEYLLGRLKSSIVFIWGHVVVAASLAIIATFYWRLTVVLFAWFISGLGGGTVFCLTRLNKGLGNKGIEMDFWEDIGHVIGVFIAIAGIVLIPFNQPMVPIYISAGIAVVTVILMLQYETFPSNIANTPKN